MTAAHATEATTHGMPPASPVRRCETSSADEHACDAEADRRGDSHPLATRKHESRKRAHDERKDQEEDEDAEQHDVQRSVGRCAAGATPA